MQTARKFRLYPSEAQKTVLRAWEGSARFVYNAKQQEIEYSWWLRKHAILSPSWHDTNPMDNLKDGSINQKFSHLKTSTTQFLKHVPSHILRNASTQYMQAWINRWKNPKHFGRPTPRKKFNCGVLLTSELFHFEEDGRLHVGSKRKPLGYIPFKAHRNWKKPNQITIKESSDGTWWLSFTFDDGQIKPSPHKPNLNSRILGIDRGVVTPLALSNGDNITMPIDQKRNLKKKQKRIKGLQQKLARQKRASKRSNRTKKIIAKLHRQIQQSRDDFCHKTSNTLVNLPYDIISFEDLKLKNMTKSAKGDIDKPGKNVPQKSGLNRSLLENSLGKICQFTEYKAIKHGKIIRYENAANSSQECSECGFTSPHNRLSQAQFHCLACNHTANADTNAATVIASRTNRWILITFYGGKHPPPCGTRGVTDAT